jgi:hypothetical protein
MKKNPFSQKRYFAFTAIGGLISFSGLALHNIETIVAGVAIYLICLLGPLLIIRQSK